MTREEARNAILTFNHLLEGGELDANVTCGDVVRATRMAIEALEKQIPKKPKRTVYNSTPDYIYCSCPVCNIVAARIKKNEYGELWEKHLPNYCDYCGQALDWSEVEE